VSFIFPRLLFYTNIRIFNLSANFFLYKSVRLETKLLFVKLLGRTSDSELIRNTIIFDETNSYFTTSPSTKVYFLNKNLPYI